MLAPKFTIRQMLLGVVVVAFLAALLGSASRGNVIGFGLGVGILSLFFVAAFYAAIYLMARVFSVGTKPTGYAPVESAVPPSINSRQPFQLDGTQRSQNGGVRAAGPIAAAPTEASPVAPSVDDSTSGMNGDDETVEPLNDSGSEDGAG